MSALATTSQVDQVQRIEELGRIILAYSEVTEKLQQSHEQLTATLASLRAELSEKNQQLERKNRLAALGEMAAGMAHEIRNPLGGIQLYASMLAKDVGEQPGALSLVNKISGGVRRLEALVSQVLQFTREIAVHVEETDLAAVVETAVELAAPKIADRRLDVQVRGERPFIVRADQHLLGQAVLNLVLNAAEAMEEGGSLSVQYFDASETDGARQFRLVVRDSGPGIPAAILDRIFNPFFTTKETGTGLGLAIVHRVIDAHDGTITATNPPGGGAQFEIRI
jgi:signal transduction histidine kinase